MATIGNTSTPVAGWHFEGVNANNQAWSTFTMPAGGGFANDAHVFFATNTGTADCYVVLWDGSGAVLGSAKVTSVGPGAHSAGGQSWHKGTFATPVYIPAGTFSLGFFVPRANGYVTSSETGGSSSTNVRNASTPGSQSGAGSTGIGALGAYVDYTPGSLYASDGAAWQGGVTVYASDGTHWQACTVWVSDGSTWRQVG